METPWGESQHVEHLASGIVSVSTAGHGGIIVAPNFDAEILRNFPTLKPWAGESNYEEDCDWAFVAVTFPALFTDQNVYHAVNTVRRAYDGKHAAELADNCAPAIRIAEQWKHANADCWIVGSMGTSGGAWTVRLRTPAGAECVRLFDDYPRRGSYTDAQLETESRPVLPAVAVA